MNDRRKALLLGLTASAVALNPRGAARAADALSIDPSGVKIDKLEVDALEITGSTKLRGAKTLEFGSGVAGKQADAGKIGYGTFAPDSLCIVGAGATEANRKITLWSEGGAKVYGDLTISERLSGKGALTVNGDAAFKKSLMVESTDHQRRLRVSPEAAANLVDIQAGTRSQESNHPKGLALYVIGKTEFRNATALDGIGISENTISSVGSPDNKDLNLMAKGAGVVRIGNSQESIRLLRGVVSKDGNTMGGAGFTVTPHGKGIYDISFQPPFSAVPAASLSQIFSRIERGPTAMPVPEEGGSTLDNVVIVVLSANVMRVKTGRSDGQAENRAFTFVVVGP